MRRGDLVTVALPGDLGKPRPALVIQADHFSKLATFTVLPITTTLVEAPLLRVQVEPSAHNGLRAPSQIMVDKVQTPATARIGESCGRLDSTTMAVVDRSLAVFLGLA